MAFILGQLNISPLLHFACLWNGAVYRPLTVDLLKQLMYRRKKPLHLVVDGLSAHKKAVVKEYVTNTEGRLSLHFLSDYAPTLILMSISGAMPSEQAWPESP